jgi:hypothetical protein
MFFFYRSGGEVGRVRETDQRGSRKPNIEMRAVLATLSGPDDRRAVHHTTAVCRKRPGRCHSGVCSVGFLPFIIFGHRGGCGAINRLLTRLRFTVARVTRQNQEVHGAPKIRPLTFLPYVE